MKKYLFLALSVFIYFHDGTVQEFKMANAFDWGRGYSYVVVANKYRFTLGDPYISQQDWIALVPVTINGGIDFVSTEKTVIHKKEK